MDAFDCDFPESVSIDLYEINKMEHQNHVLDIINNLDKACSICIFDGFFDSLNFLQNSKHLKKIEFIYCRIGSCQGIERLSNLKKLAINESIIIDQKQSLNSISQLHHIENLELNHCALKEASQIFNLANLKELMIQGNGIIDITGISKLECLEILDVSRNKIKDPNELNRLKSLKKLYYWYNIFNSKNFQPNCLCYGRTLYQTLADIESEEANERLASINEKNCNKDFIKEANDAFYQEFNGDYHDDML